MRLLRVIAAVVLEVLGVLAAIPTLILGKLVLALGNAQLRSRRPFVVLVFGKVVLVLGDARLRASSWLQGLDRRIDRLREI